ncbi:lysoplasmalogenase [Microbacterium sp. H83]|uniref:lysoplasmalogenase n=1 Tax=Microbacterium sp. H83 TaxID=1827324 RepID=UPI0007F4B54C|nr:lysoplasmalogenase [Microbacterium sp. H83]OAN43090.1 hypothetical protein A4X16_08585 [Microbacterium sp. H83]
MQSSESSAPPLWTFAPYIVASALHVVLLAIDSPGAQPSKLLLMPLLALPVLLTLSGTRPRAAVALLLSAIAFSWLGDGVGPFFPDAQELPLMLLFFGIAHLAYIALFLLFLGRRRMPWWALVYAAWWIAMLAGLGGHVGALLLPVAAYGLVLASTAAFSARCHPLVAAGGALFLASDTVLALRLFLPESLPEWSSPAVMLTYALSQGLIVAGTLSSLSREAE